MRLFIFDMGGVVCLNTSVAPEIANYLNIPIEEFLKLAKLSGIDLLQTGYISTHEFWKNFSKHFGSGINDDLWIRFFKPVPISGTVRLIKKLKQKFRVVVGTNTISSHYEFHMKTGQYDLFDAIYASHIIHIAKPNPEFFRYILKSEAVSSREVFFVDDDLRNVESARKMGINSFLFTSPEDLQSELEKLLGHIVYFD